MPAARVGLIGIGLLGSAIAERLLASGVAVHGFDIDPRGRERLAAAGGTVGESAPAVFRECADLFLSLPDSVVVGIVLDSIDRACLAGRTVMDTTTGAPRDAARFGQEVAAAGGCYLDTTVAGSSEQVRQREAIVIAGGERAALDRCRPLLTCLGRAVYHVGPCGSGSSMKLVFNLVLGLNRAALAEGLSLAEASGLPVHTALEILQAGPAHSRAMDHKGIKMISGEFSPQARLRQHLKDVRLMLAEGARHGCRLSLSEQHAALLETAEAMGFGDADNSAVIKAYD